VPAISLPLPDGRYEMRFLEPILISNADSLAEITQRCWDEFEPHIRAQPEIWMWMYKHWRYLPDGAAAEQYPTYANRSKKFDKLHKNFGSAAHHSTDSQ
jgi:lauroyl/myristoyl acyltransferase